MYVWKLTCLPAEQSSQIDFALRYIHNNFLILRPQYDNGISCSEAHAQWKMYLNKINKYLLVCGARGFTDRAVSILYLFIKYSSYSYTSKTYIIHIFLYKLHDKCNVVLKKIERDHFIIQLIIHCF